MYEATNLNLNKSKFLNNFTAPMPANKAGNPPATLVIFVNKSKNAVAPSTAPLKISELNTDVEKSWNCALNLSIENCIPF